MFLSVPNHVNNIKNFNLQNHKCQTQQTEKASQVRLDRKRKGT